MDCVIVRRGDALEIADKTEPETPLERIILGILIALGGLIWGKKKMAAGYEKKAAEIASASVPVQPPASVPVQPPASP